MTVFAFALFTFVKRHWLAIGLLLILLLPLVGFLLASLGLILVTYWPRDFDEIDVTSVRAGAPHLIVIAHGVKDSPATWSAPLASLLKDKKGAATQVIALDWEAYAGNTLNCAILGKRIGDKLGREIAQHRRQNNRPASLHLIGHSCGAFVIYGLCEAVRRELSPDTTPIIQTSYLDPVSVHGLRWRYGINHFGRCGDYSEAYIDTRDRVPGSNERLPHAHTIDVTAAQADQIPPHLWPIFYYRQLVVQERAPDYFADPGLKARHPPGELEVIAGE